MPVTDYSIIVRSGTTLKDVMQELQREVVTAIKRGWQPLGGISLDTEQTANGTYGFVAAQAIVKEA